QAGVAVSAASGTSHAGMWSGTAASWVDLNPAGSNYSAIEAMIGTVQAGWDDDPSGTTHAGVWNGTAGSFEDLSLLLPGSWGNTEATGIWSDASKLYVSGWGLSHQDFDYHALLCTRPISAPEPDTAALLCLGGLTVIRRRRSGPAARRRTQRASRPCDGLRRLMEALEVRSLLSGLPYPTAATVSQLIADINYADNTGGAFTVNLQPGTIFDVKNVDNTTNGANGLPVIGATRPVDLTILGNGDTIERVGTKAMRF